MRTYFAFLLLLALYATAVHPAARSVKTPASSEAMDGSAAWARILEDNVDSHGRVDFRRLAVDSSRLARHTQWLAVHGPVSTPADFATRDAILAYRLNAYNANAMLTVLRAGASGSLGGWRRTKVFVLSPIRIDGSWTSLYRYENQVIRPLGDPRVHFALNCMVKGCPQLPREPFSAELLDAQLNLAAREFVQEQRNVSVDRPSRVVWLSSIFSFYTEDFLQKSESLIAYINQFREPGEAVPKDFTIRFFPYDWTVNRQHAE